jgi:hypothetical protein
MRRLGGLRRPGGGRRELGIGGGELRRELLGWCDLGLELVGGFGVVRGLELVGRDLRELLRIQLWFVELWL